MAIIDLRQWNDLDILSSRFILLDGLRALPQNADGEVFRAGGSTRLWKGRLAIAKKRFADALAFKAKLFDAISPGNVLLWHDPTHDGVSISATSVTVSGSTLGFAGLTGSKLIRAGDYVSWTSANITHLHQFVNAKTNTNTTASAMVVTPPPRITGSVTTTVTIGQAPLKCFIIPGSIDWMGATGSVDDGLSFDWIQTLGDYV